MTAFQDLCAHQRKVVALGQISGRLGWDQETSMPGGAGAQRGEEFAAIEAVLHQLRTDPKVGDWLSQIDPASLSEVDQSHLRLIRRSYDRNKKLPERLASELAQATSTAHAAWAAARKADDFKAFAPVLEGILALKREEAAALADGDDLYDALLDDYEPEAKAADLAAMFEALRPGLVSLRQAVLDQPAKAGVSGAFPEAQQMELALKVAQIFGYDLNRGRLDKAVHPFSSGSGNDVRITTRTEETDPFNCLYSTIHETGHACYEQNIDQAYLLTPLGSGVSMGVHESQSRIYENQIGRSRAFTGWLFGQMRDTFGDFGISNEEAFYAAVNSVRNGFIRTEADELQYNLHVMLRFDLERALIAGDLAVNDLECAWNDRFQADFGFAVDRASHGVLQDVHWSAGLFGYFPTYSLGNVYAGCLNAALRRDVPDLDADLARGDTSAATAWLTDKIHQHGSRYAPRQVIEMACGEPPSEAPLMAYLNEKFSDLYDL
ncbi:MAG: carboxypeptidase M32 [Pelagimonas sp.]|jgi:carboxypeptidase Taq|nr:carboxypeptidase M32 [Pelagimonas sp.]